MKKGRKPRPKPSGGRWYVYLLRCADGTLYTGIAKDVTRRCKQHNAGTASRYTRSRLPVVVVYQEAHASRSSVLKREAAIKALSRRQKMALIRLQVLMPTTRNLAILIFDEVEVLDFCGPFEVFSVANRFTDSPAFHVFTVAEKPGPVLTRGGLSVNPHKCLANCPRPDLLLIPGGQGTRKEMHNPALIDWIRQASSEAELVLSVCTGALLLAKAGLLDGLEATTHKGAIDLLREVAPRTTIQADRRFVDNGRMVCSAGIAAGIDMSLHVVARLVGREVAEKTARQMEYPWVPCFGPAAL